MQTTATKRKPSRQIEEDNDSDKDIQVDSEVTSPIIHDPISVF